jgi:DNA-binding NtrC family response regulator
MNSRLLVVEDDPLLRDFLCDALDQGGYEVKSAASAADALGLLEAQLFDVAIVDVGLPDLDGVELLRRIKAHDPALEVVMMTGYPEVKTAVAALKLGAYDYLTKPVNAEDLARLVARLLERNRLRQEVSELRSRLGERLTSQELVGVSVPMHAIRAAIEQVAPTDSTVLIEGETGTGKELVAAAIHHHSARREQPFIPVNCGGIPSELVESEFFGHVRGAFSGAVADYPGLFRAAHGGTLFLDELTELPAVLQVKLLRALQEREVRPVGSARTFPVDIRVVGATNRPLEEAVREGRLRADLYYRLNVVKLQLPPLRERPEDIPSLAAHFIRGLNARFRRDVLGIAPEALVILSAHAFPGNVRELEHLLERAFALGARQMIQAADLPTLAPPAAPGLPPLERAERNAIAEALQQHGNDKAATASALGISRRTLYRRLKELRLS